MNLLEAIDEARRCLDAPPANEAQTCEWAVIPLLRATGYSSRYIHAQSRDAGDKLPDYTVLPGDANDWFLEVKMWDAILEGKPEIQATTYATPRGSAGLLSLTAGCGVFTTTTFTGCPKSN